jgi:minor extracellular serine protease Vpr
MKRIAMLIAAAALLNACGGGSDQAESQASASNESMAGTTAAGSISSPYRVTAPQGIVVNRIDRRLHGARGSVDVWVTLDQNSVAAERAALAESSGMATAQGGELAKAMGAVRKAAAHHRQRIGESQAALASNIASVGGRELARVQVAHNAIAVRIDASQLTQLAALSGVARVRPVLNYEMTLSETVPYVGGTAVHASGRDGTGVTVAVLDSGVDYTHRNLGGPGTLAAYQAAYGTSPSDPKNTTRDGLFPTAKVVEGFDFVGEQWPNCAPGVDCRSEDPDPIDAPNAPPTDGGHGTHVADIIAGKSVDGTHKGTAPGAKLVAVKVCSSVSTACSGVALLRGMDFALDPNGDGDTSDAVDIINMSLGSDYGQIEDDLTEASTNAVKLGVVVVAAAGNGSNKPYVVGSPSIAPGVISVAQTHVPSAQAIPLVINSPAAIAGTYPNTATVEWAPITNGFSGEVKLASQAIGTPNASNLACDALPPGSLAGKVALADRGTCAVSIKVHNAATAGAIGVLIANNVPGDAPSFSFGGPIPFTPAQTLILTQAVGALIKANVAAPVVVTVSPVGIPLVGSMVSTSSRGPSISKQSIKPEIGAPGASVSAEVGTGTGETAFGGTSGASPMVAGAAALLRQAYPNRSPEKIKAMLMNSAETAVFTNPALLPGELAPITRIGAGELRVDRAIAQTAIAWNRATKSAALSFGALEVESHMVVERTLRIENFANTARNFTITPSFRYASDEASGAVKVQVRSGVHVSAGGHEDIDVKLIIDPNKLSTWTLNGGPLGGNGAALNGPEYDGYITLTAGSEKISVPWHVLPRKAAETDATLKEAHGRFGPTVKLRNKGAEVGEFEVFSLIGVSKKIPRSELPGPGDNFAVIDMRSVGVRHLPAAVFGADFLEFAINTNGRRAHPNYPAEFDIYIDTTGDGVPDFVVFNAELGGFSVTGQNAVFLFNLSTNTATAVFFTDADLNSGNVIFTVPMNSSAGSPNLGVAPGTTIGIDVFAFDNYFSVSGNLTDEITGMRFTPGTPRFGVVGLPFGGVAPHGSADLGVTTANVPDTQSSELGLLMMYRRNAGQEADRVLLP